MSEEDKVVPFNPMSPELLAEKHHAQWLEKIRAKYPNITNEELMQHLAQRLLALHIQTLEMAFEGAPVDERVTRKAVYDLHVWLNARSTAVTDLRIMYSVMHVLKNRGMYL